MARKLFIDSANSFWVSRSQGSGTRNYGLLNNNHGTVSCDGRVGVKDSYLCDTVEEVLKRYRAVRVKDVEFTTVKLYKLPVYGQKLMSGERYDIFGGEVKPTGYVYMSFSKYGQNKEKSIISFWESFKEANGFHQFNI